MTISGFTSQTTFFKFSKSRISPTRESIFFATPASSNKDGLVGAANASPVTLAPAFVNQSEVQLPLNPVCPVRKTFFPDQKLGFTTFFAMLVPTKLSMEHVLTANFLQENFCLVACP